MSLQTYLNQLREFNPLSREELLPLIKKAQRGNQQARNKIVRHNLRLVVYIAKRYGNSKKPKKYSKKTEQMLRWADMKVASLNILVGEDSELVELLGVTYPITKEIDFRLIYEALIKILTPRERGILKDRLAGLTLKEVGKKYSLSRERIRQIELEIVQLLKTKINLYSDYKEVILYMRRSETENHTWLITK